jgi:hypothetical protein
MLRGKCVYACGTRLSDGYNAASGSKASKPHFHPIEKVRESKFKGF